VFAGRRPGGWAAVFLTAVAGSTFVAPALAGANSTASPGRQQLVATTQVPSSGLSSTMVELFAKAHGLPVSWVAGVGSGSFHEDTVDGVTWAEARFDPTGTADQVDFQDGGGIGVFVERAGDWSYAKAAVSNGCAVGLPETVNQAWGLDNPSSCGIEEPQARASSEAVSGVGAIAASQVGVLDNPAATSSTYSASNDCNPYTAIESPSEPACDADSTITDADGSTTTVQNHTEFWCSDFAKWVWSQAGQPDTDVLNGDASSFYTWGQDNGDTLTVDGTNVQVGDAVVLYSPSVTPGPGVYAAHVGIIVGVSGSSVTTVNGDFFINSGQTIGVYEQTNSSLAQYASAAEDTSGEQWVLVAPSTNSPPPPPALLGITAVLQSDGNQNVYYVGANGQVYDWYFDSSGWSNAQLGSGEAVASGTGLAAVLQSDGNQNVYYVGANGQVYDWYFDSSGWSNAQLAASSSQPPALTSADSTTMSVGSAGSFTVTTTGIPTPSLSESGTLPSGITFINNGNGTATLAGTPSTATVGPYSINITASNGVAPDATQDFTLTVSGLATTTTPTVKPTSVTRGSKVTYKATVSTSSGTPTGSVTFSIGTTTICSASLKSAEASCASTKAPTGSDTVTASYAGDNTYAASTGSTTVKVTVDPTTTTASVDPTSATKGQAVTYSATVTSSQGVPTGTVVFTIGSKTICTAALKSGTATCTSTKAPKGSDTVTATYKGSANDGTSVGTTTLKVT